MLRTDIADLLVKKYGKKNAPQVKPGDTVRVHQKIKEGEKERIQIFEGLVIAVRHGRGLDGSFTVRKIAVGGIGVERTYPLHSPNIVKVERVKTAKVSRAKLYYMRDRKGKTARFKVEGSNASKWEEPADEPIVPETEAADMPEAIEEPVVEAPEVENEKAVEAVEEMIEETPAEASTEELPANEESSEEASK